MSLGCFVGVLLGLKVVGGCVGDPVGIGVTGLPEVDTLDAELGILDGEDIG